MRNKSLFLIQSNDAATSQCLDKVLRVHTMADSIILMGDAVLWVEDPRLKYKQNIFILTVDAELLIRDAIPENIQIIDYAAFADLILRYTRCISLQ